MAKSKPRTRDASHIASSRPFTYNQHFDNLAAAALWGDEPKLDRRQWRPDESTRPPTTRPSRFARVVETVIKVRQRRRQFHARLNKFNPAYQIRSALRTRLGFSVPRRLEVCLRRSVRKEVMHAKRKSGKAGQRKPIRNFWSAISCRR